MILENENLTHRDPPVSSACPSSDSIMHNSEYPGSSVGPYDGTTDDGFETRN